MLHDDDKIDADFVETCMSAAGYDKRVGVIRTGTRIINANGTVIKEGRNRVAGLSWPISSSGGLWQDPAVRLQHLV
jgi:hypothetical protein